MAAKQRKARRSWSTSEKRRLVELTLRSDGSVHAIAVHHGVEPRSLYRWRARYRAGTLGTQTLSGAAASAASFIPVNIVPAIVRSQSISTQKSRDRGVVELSLSSGAVLRLESAGIDAALLCALVAELKRGA